MGKKEKSSMKIVILCHENLFQVQGLTTKYYTYHYFKKNHQVLLLVGPINNKRATLFLPVKKEMVWFLPRICLLPFVFDILSLIILAKEKWWKFDLLYCYRKIFLPPLFAKILFKKKVVYDLRVPPVEQEIEFLKIYGQSKSIKALIYKINAGLYQLLLPRLDGIITLSSGIRKLLIERYSVSPRKIYILTLGVDLEKFDPKKFLRKNERRINSLLYIGTIAPARMEGLEIVLKAMKILKKEGIKLKFVLVGRQEKEGIKKLKRHAQKMGLSRELVWKGQVAHDEIPKVISNYEIALSCLSDIQSFHLASPAKLFEYLAMEKVVIASDIDSNRSILKEGYNGLLYHPRSAQSLARQIKKVIVNPILRQKLKHRARESVQDYQWATILKKLDEKLQEWTRQKAFSSKARTPQ